MYILQLTQRIFKTPYSAVLFEHILLLSGQFINGRQWLLLVSKATANRLYTRTALCKGGPYFAPGGPRTMTVSLSPTLHPSIAYIFITRGQLYSVSRVRDFMPWMQCQRSLCGNYGKRLLQELHT